VLLTASDGCVNLQGQRIAFFEVGICFVAAYEGNVWSPFNLDLFVYYHGWGDSNAIFFGGRYWLADEHKIILNEFIYKRIGLIRAERTS